MSAPQGCCGSRNATTRTRIIQFGLETYFKVGQETVGEICAHANSLVGSGGRVRHGTWMDGASPKQLRLGLEV